MSSISVYFLEDYTTLQFNHYPFLWFSFLPVLYLFFSFLHACNCVYVRACVCVCMFPQCPEVRGTYHLCVDSVQPSQILISFSALLLWGDTAEDSKDLSANTQTHTHTHIHPHTIRHSDTKEFSDSSV